MDGTLWLYVLLVLTTLPPFVPNSVLIAAAGALAAAGRLSLPLVLLTVAGSALAGDAVVHWLGCRAGGRVRGWLSLSPRRRAALDWTAARMWRHGVPFVFVARFLPSGRFVGGFAAGTVGYPRRRYLFGAGLAEAFWATYSVGIGYWGGQALAGTLPGALVGLGASLVLAGVASTVSWAVRRRARSAATLPSQQRGQSGLRPPEGEGIRRPGRVETRPQGARLHGPPSRRSRRSRSHGPSPQGPRIPGSPPHGPASQGAGPRQRAEVGSRDGSAGSGLRRRAGPRPSRGVVREGRGPVLGGVTGGRAAVGSASSPMARSPRDPVADGIGVPVGLARFHQIGRR